MSFKYINPGYSKLLKLQKANTSLKDITVSEAQSRTGVAFVQRYSSDSYPPYSISLNCPNGEFWAKCDVYFYNDTGTDISFGHYSHYVLIRDLKTVDVYLNSNKIETIYSSNVNLQSEMGLKLNALNTIWLHVKEGADGFIEFKFNNKYIGKFVTDSVVKHSESYDYFRICANDTRIYNYSSYNCYVRYPFSNIIISDEEIASTETIIPLPVSETVTDMSTLEGGLYVADTVGKTLWQSADINSLVSEYGGDAKVTGIALIGNPAYSDGQGLGYLTALTKNNGVVYEHDEVFCPADSDSIIFSTFAISTETTIADLANMQFGWRS